MGIYVEENVVIIEQEDLDLAGAIKLKELMEDFAENGSESMIISLRKVKKLSGTALGVIRRASQTFKTFKLENINASIAEDLKEL